MGRAPRKSCPPRQGASEREDGVAQAAHGEGRVAGADPRHVFAQGHVAQVVQGLHPRVLADVSAEPGSGDLGHRQVSQNVDPFEGRLAGGQDTAVHELPDLVGRGEGKRRRETGGRSRQIEATETCPKRTPPHRSALTCRLAQIDGLLMLMGK